MVWGQASIDAKCDFLNRTFLQHCQDRTVLEIGCFGGWITERLMTNSPKQVILLEANGDAVATVTERFPTARVIQGDMHDDLEQVGKVDVALLFGIIYHSHAPFYMLEKLVNYCDPETVIIDNMNPQFSWHEETPNIPGMRYTVGDWRTCNIVVNIDNLMTVRAMDNLGYRLVSQDTYPDDAQGAGRPIFHFEKHHG
jgi:SAM-dependent methyltransferase